MSCREVVTAFWAVMRANDWEGAARRLAPECAIDWPCSGERILGRADFAAVQARYPTSTGAGASMCTAWSSTRRQS